MIPVQCEYFALEGLTQLLSTIRLVQKLWNPRLSIEGVLLTMFDVRTKLSVEVQQEVRKYFKEKVYHCFIPRMYAYQKLHLVNNQFLSMIPVRKVRVLTHNFVKEVVTQNERIKR